MLRIYGASDDLIEIEGDIREEFLEEDGMVVLSNGDAFFVKYNEFGLWKISQVSGNPDHTRFIFTATNPDSESYSDIIEINDSISWVAYCTIDYFKRKIKD